MKNKLNDIRLVVSDIDGTILTSENCLHPTTMGAVQAFNKKNNCNFTFSTGRAFPRVKPMVDLFGLCSPFIFSGGAVFDLANDQALPSPSLSGDQIAQISNIAGQVDVGLIAHTAKKMFCQMNDRDWNILASLEWMKGKKINHIARVKDMLEDIQEDIIRVDLFSEDGDIEAIYRYLITKASGIHAVPMNRSIEVTPVGVHKGTALKRLAVLMHVKKSRIMAIGDSMNDLPLLAEAGVSVAMGTSPDKLKAIADIVVASSDSGGFTQALDLLL